MAALIPSASATGSGTMTLAGPSTNSNQTVTIPDATGTMMVSGNMPAFSARNSSNQTSISSATWTKVTFDTEDFDTNSNFASSTFTPTVAGYYQFNSVLRLAFSAAWNAGGLSFYKNGSEFRRQTFLENFTTLSSNTHIAGSALIYLNGSSDYVEIYGYMASSTGTRAFGFDTSNVACFFNGCMVRGA
jgi:hypothetical protein